MSREGKGTRAASKQGNSRPTDWREAERGTLAVQRRLVVADEALGDCVNLGEDEVVVEIPPELVRYFPRPE